MQRSMLLHVSACLLPDAINDCETGLTCIRRWLECNITAFLRVVEPPAVCVQRSYFDAL